MADRPPIERFLVFEALLISAGAPVAASWFADRQMGPTLLQFGTPIGSASTCRRSSTGEARRGPSG